MITSCDTPIRYYQVDSKESQQIFERTYPYQVCIVFELFPQVESLSNRFFEHSAAPVTHILEQRRVLWPAHHPIDIEEVLNYQ